jgi:hypothetical protein
MNKKTLIIPVSLLLFPCTICADNTNFNLATTNTPAATNDNTNWIASGVNPFENMDDSPQQSPSALPSPQPTTPLNDASQAPSKNGQQTNNQQPLSRVQNASVDHSATTLTSTQHDTSSTQTTPSNTISLDFSEPSDTYTQDNNNQTEELTKSSSVPQVLNQTSNKNNGANQETATSPAPQQNVQQPITKQVNVNASRINELQQKNKELQKQIELIQGDVKKAQHVKDDENQINTHHQLERSQNLKHRLFDEIKRNEAMIVKLQHQTL